MQYGCIGEKLSHSFSKEIHGALAGYEYCLKELSPQQVAPFLKARQFRAVNVTIPYKQTVMEHLDFVSDTAKKIGAVNTIVNRDGKLYGYNTDFYGLEYLLTQNGIELKDKKVLILGSGGTSKTAKAVAEKLGAAEILRVSRGQKEDCITYEQAYAEHSDAQVIINTTPCGMFPHIEQSPMNIASFAKLEAVVDVVYNPICSKLVLQARERGIIGVGGLQMLVMQAVKAIEFFTGELPDEQRALQVYRRQLRQKQNIVLIGMASCGKSSVGVKVAEMLGREFIDTDRLIEQKAGKTIPEIFSECSEEGFREMESEVILSLAASQGKVIATGGGAILRAQNLSALKQNGVIIFLDRPLCELTSTKDRPLSSTKAELEKRFFERYDKYMAAAEMKVAVSSADGIVGTAEKLIKEWEK